MIHAAAPLESKESVFKRASMVQKNSLKPSQGLIIKYNICIYPPINKGLCIQKGAEKSLKPSQDINLKLKSYNIIWDLYETSLKRKTLYNAFF